MNDQHTYFTVGRIIKILLLLCTIMSLNACYRLPFLPHREIDTFQPVASKVTDTMEVRGVTYVRVIKPGSGEGQEKPATSWIPLDVFRKGDYQPYQSPMVKKSLPATRAETQSAETAVNKNLEAAGLTAGTPQPGTKELTEEELLEATKTTTTMPLQRRGICFPSRATIRYPQITSQLIINLEQQLPLTMLPVDYISPRDDSWQTNDTDELIAQSKGWLKSVSNLPPAQLIFLLTEEISSFYPRFLVTILDAQSAKPVASFSFVIKPGTSSSANLVPPQPQPLIQLVLTSPWWCSATPGHNKKTVFLTAGQKSRVTDGLHLKLCQPAEKIFDPQNGALLGFAIGKPFAEAVVTDFFGQDGAIASLRTPTKIPSSGCLAVLYQ
ncbi:MAG: hypothetical protein U9P37_04615 [Pseudomonadota bacterium]|nr:hypothetical protein [Pseudomonadota bacterium]